MEKRKGSLWERHLADGVFSKMFLVTLVAMMTGFLCGVVDNIVTGQFLGSNAVAAMGLVNPVTSFASLITALFVSGTSQLCVRSMGKAELERVNQIFSTMAVCATALCTLSGAALFALAPQIMSAIAQGAEEEAVRMAVEYLRGYSLLIPPMGLVLLLNGVLPLDNGRKRCLGTAVLMLLLDAALDLLNVFVLHMGMLGMALASALSVALSLIFLLLHFRKGGHLLRFTPHNLCFADVKEVLTYSLATAIPMLMTSIRSGVLNLVLLRTEGTHAVAAFSVAGAAFVLILSLITSIQSTTASLTGLAYGEEDVGGMERTFRLSLLFSCRAYLIIGGIFFVLASPIAGFFIHGGETAIRELAGSFVRFMVIQYAMMIVSYVFTGSFTGTEHVKLNYLLSLLKDGVYPCLSAVALGLAFGLPGVKASFVLTGVLTVLTCPCITFILNRRFPRSVRDFLILPDDFGPDIAECFEASAGNMEQVAEMSEQAYQFCMKRGEDKRTANFVSLFVEEMAGNAVRHGFDTVKNGRVELKLILKEGKRMIRLKDNGRPFDPVRWLEDNHPEDPEKNLGIRMIIGLAKDARYVPTMEINNFLVLL